MNVKDQSLAIERAVNVVSYAVPLSLSLPAFPSFLLATTFDVTEPLSFDTIDDTAT